MFRFFFLQVVTSADVIIQVLDARDPLGSRCEQVEQTVLQAGTQKRLVLLLNKIGKNFLLRNISVVTF